MGSRHPRGTTALGWGALGLLGAGAYAGFGIAPPDAVQGQVQRIMYLHVPAAWVSLYVASALVLVGSAVYLWRRQPAWDRLARSAVEVGAVFTALTLVTGSIWGKPTWGAWWTWDARLTTTALLLVIYIGYLMVRGVVEDPDRAARFAAIVGILGVLDVPIIHMSVVWWRTLHQPPSVLRMEGAPTMAPVMLFALLLNMTAYTVLFVYLLRRKMELEAIRDACRAAKP